MGQLRARAEGAGDLAGEVALTQQPDRPQHAADPVGALLPPALARLALAPDRRTAAGREAELLGHVVDLVGLGADYEERDAVRVVRERARPERQDLGRRVREARRRRRRGRQGRRGLGRRGVSRDGECGRSRLNVVLEERLNCREIGSEREGSAARPARASRAGTHASRAARPRRARRPSLCQTRRPSRARRRGPPSCARAWSSRARP